jgi:hypothetical protein
LFWRSAHEEERPVESKRSRKNTEIDGDIIERANAENQENKPKCNYFRLGESINST